MLLRYRRFCPTSGARRPPPPDPLGAPDPPHARRAAPRASRQGRLVYVQSLKLATTALTRAWQSFSRCKTPKREHSQATSGVRSTRASPTAPWPAFPSSTSWTLSMQTRPCRGSKSARTTTAGSAWSKAQNRMLRRVGPLSSLQEAIYTRLNQVFHSLGLCCITGHAQQARHR